MFFDGDYETVAPEYYSNVFVERLFKPAKLKCEDLNFEMEGILFSFKFINKLQFKSEM